MYQRQGSISFRILACVLYFACVVAVVVGMNRARSYLLAVYGTEQAHGNWRNWRSAAGDDTGPVIRDEPASALPPAYVLMRQYYPACLGFALLITTVMFGTLLLMIRGAFFYEQAATQVGESTPSED